MSLSISFLSCDKRLSERRSLVATSLSTVYCLFLEERQVIIDSASPVLLGTAFDVAEGVTFSAALVLDAIGLSTS